jgi:hypothetical protein
MTTLPNLRIELTEAKITLRELEQEAETVKAIAETEIIAEANGDYGKNEADRKRFLTVALDKHQMYDEALDKLNAARRVVDQLSAQLAMFDDERRQARLIADERHTVALERLAAAWEQLGGLPLVQAQGRQLVAEDTTEWFGR